MNFKMKIWSRHIAQNMNEKNWKILPWTLFCSYFRQWDDTIFSFWNFLTFTCSNGVNFCHILIRVHSSVSKGRDVPRDVPGQTGTGRPIVPLSRDKKKLLSREKITPQKPGKRHSKTEKGHSKQENDVLKQEKDVLKQEKDVLKQKKDIPKQERMF